MNSSSKNKYEIALVLKKILGKKCYLVHHHYIDNLIEIYFDIPEYKSSWIEGWERGDHRIVELNTSETFQDPQKYIDALKAGKPLGYGTNAILGYLFKQGVIPEGTYVITVNY